MVKEFWKMFKMHQCNSAESQIETELRTQIVGRICLF